MALTSTVASLTSQAAVYDANDRLLNENYDSNGNTLSSGGVTYTYDFEDRLISATKGGVAVAMQYDGDGNRVVRTEGGSAVRYLVDELTPMGYVQVAEEVANGAVARAYLHGWQRISQRRLVSNTWLFSYYGYDDSAGSVRLLLGSDALVTDRYSYTGYGNSLARSGTTSNEYSFRGERYEPLLDAYYLRDRWLNIATGRFLTADPLESPFALGDRLHRYSYVHGDPINFVDPSGNVERVLLAQFAVRFGHGARHLAGSGLSRAEVEAIITQAVQSAAGSPVGTWIPNAQVLVQGIPVIYRTFVLTETVLVIGSYFVGGPNYVPRR